MTVLFTWSSLQAQTIDSVSYRSIVSTLQKHTSKHPSVFPLEAYEGEGTQRVIDGLNYAYFGYGERRYSHRTDFHPAMDLAYFPLERGDVLTEQGEKRPVRAPQTYLKKVFAIQKGVLVSFSLTGSGYRLVLRHELETPYFDSNKKPYHHYYTCYRHLDSRSRTLLNDVAQKALKDKSATYQSLIGKHVFEAGEPIALVGFPPKVKVSRVHLDYSLNLFGDPSLGNNIRKFALDPLLLFPAFKYADPRSHKRKKKEMSAYLFYVDENKAAAPQQTSDGHFDIEIHAGGVEQNGVYKPRRYFALRAMKVVVNNGGKELGSMVVDRHLKTGYNTSSFDKLDSLNVKQPHFDPPLGEQSDVFRMKAVIPTQWLQKMGYDWSKPGSLSITLTSIWAGFYKGHEHSLVIPLKVPDK